MTNANADAKTQNETLPETTDMADRYILGYRWNNEPIYRPQSGDAATVCIGTDRYAATIVGVSVCGKKVTVRDDSSRAIKGSDYYGTQRYEYLAAPEAMTRQFSLRKSGAWRLVGEKDQSGYGLIIGERRTYNDPSF